MLEVGSSVGLDAVIRVVQVVDYLLQVWGTDVATNCTHTHTMLNQTWVVGLSTAHSVVTIKAVPQFDDNQLYLLYIYVHI